MALLSALHTQLPEIIALILQQRLTRAERILHAVNAFTTRGDAVGDESKSVEAFGHVGMMLCEY